MYAFFDISLKCNPIITLTFQIIPALVPVPLHWHFPEIEWGFGLCLMKWPCEIEMLQYLPYFWNAFLFDTISYVELFLSKVQCQAELSHIHKLYM